MVTIHRPSSDICRVTTANDLISPRVWSISHAILKSGGEADLHRDSDAARHYAHSRN